jgi:hypothetical protein
MKKDAHEQDAPTGEHDVLGARDIRADDLLPPIPAPGRDGWHTSQLGLTRTFRRVHDVDGPALHDFDPYAHPYA